MTNEEARGILAHLEAYYRDLDPLMLTNDSIQIVNKRIEALGMAISALHVQNSETRICATCKHNPPSKKYPCVDCDMREPADRWEKQDAPDTNIGDMVSMSETSYIGDGFFYSQEMREQARRIEEMTNPLFVPESFAGVAYLRGGNYRYREHYGYGAHIGMTREELDMLHDAENEKDREET